MYKKQKGNYLQEEQLFLTDQRNKSISDDTK
jgi:hypothetical protein